MKLLNLFNYGSTRLDILEDIGDFVMSFVGQILWLFCDIFFLILDLFEDLFRKFAGIDTNVTSATGEKIEGDLVLYFVNSSVVQEIFMAILILSLFLLIIFTIFAIVKNQYSDKQEPVSKFINGSFKALLMYLLVPIATVVCLLVGNIVLQAIDGATKGSANAATASDMLFLSATYNANKLRNGTSAEKKKDIQDMIKNHNLPEQVKLEIEKQCQVDLDSDFNAGLVDFDLMANIIDDAFIAGVLAGDTDAENAKSDKWNFYVVDSYYNSMRISYIIIWVGGAFLIWAIGKITWGMIARLFKMVLYFAISPAVMATFPIDGGKALGAWRGEMVKNGTSAYCAIGVLNILYSILPFFNNIDMFGDSSRGVGITTLIVRLFIYIIAFSSAKDLIGAVSGWFGTGNALADGISASGQVKAGLQKPGKMLTGAATKGVGYFAGIKSGIGAARDNGGSKIMGAISGGMSATGFGKSFSDVSKAYKSAGDSGAAAQKSWKTFSLDGDKKKTKTAQYEAREAINKEMKAIKAAELRLNAAFDEEVSAKGYTAGSDEYKKLQARYAKEKDALRASAAFVQPLYESREKVLESMQKKNDEQSSYFQAFDDYSKAQATMDKYKAMFAGLFDDKKKPMSDDQWESFKVGKFDDTDGADPVKLKNLYETHASGMFETQREIDMGVQKIQNLYKLGDDTREFVDQFKDYLNIGVDASGASSVEGVKAGTVADFVNKIEEVRSDLNKTTEELKATKKSIKKGKVADVGRAESGTLSDSELNTIGRNLKK